MKKIIPKPKGEIQQSKADNSKIHFSYLYYDSSDKEVCPPTFQPNYTQILMERLKALSSWTFKEFTNSHSKSIRAHTHDWGKTARPKGFQHLNEELRSASAWQFQLSKSEYGRVHGFFIGNVFYVVWLDRDHKIYPSKR